MNCGRETLFDIKDLRLMTFDWCGREELLRALVGRWGNWGLISIGECALKIQECWWHSAKVSIAQFCPSSLKRWDIMHSSSRVSGGRGWSELHDKITVKAMLW